MLYPEKVKILAKKNQPKPEEARYWIDLTADPYGGIWKVWNGLTWIRVFASSGHKYIKINNHDQKRKP